MGVPAFHRLAEDEKIPETPGTRCRLKPNDGLTRHTEGVFFAGLSNGYFAPFFVSGHVDESIQVHRSRNHRHFLRAPPWAEECSFDGTRKTLTGWKYKIQWWSKQGEDNGLDKMSVLR